MFEYFRERRINRLIQKADLYCNEHYVDPPKPVVTDNTIRYSTEEPEITERPYIDSIVRNMLRSQNDASSRVLNRYLQRTRELTFVQKVMEYIRERRVQDSVIYKKAQIDRRLFSKMMSDIDYKPSKDTAIAIAFALFLDLDQTRDLLQRAGYALSHSNKRDLVIECFFKEGNNNLDDINLVLDRLGMKTIGRY